jgi:hypothetical protein
MRLDDRGARKDAPGFLSCSIQCESADARFKGNLGSPQ